MEQLLDPIDHGGDHLFLSEHLAREITENLGDRPLVAATVMAQADVLTPDYAEAGRLAARHVLDRAGHDILYVHEAGSPGADLRRAGFEEVCRGAGVDAGRLVIELPERGAAGDRYGAVRSRIGQVRGLAASTDFLALDLMLVACESGRMPGRQMAIMGQGNELAGALVSPALTTIDFAGEEIGRRAMDLALQRVGKVRQDAPQQVLVPPMLIERESTRS